MYFSQPVVMRIDCFRQVGNDWKPMFQKSLAVVGEHGTDSLPIAVSRILYSRFQLGLAPEFRVKFQVVQDVAVSAQYQLKKRECIL